MYTDTNKNKNTNMLNKLVKLFMGPTGPTRNSLEGTMLFTDVSNTGFSAWVGRRKAEKVEMYTVLRLGRRAKSRKGRNAHRKQCKYQTLVG